jgi:4-carboxymuconolactone decarboxylase
MAVHPDRVKPRVVPRETVKNANCDEGRPTMSAAPDDTPIIDLVAKMTADSLESTSLDDHSLMLVRIAALAAVDAPPASYLMNIGAADKSGVSADQITGVLTAVAPIIGTARVVSAAGKVLEALGLAIEIAELEEEE